MNEMESRILEIYIKAAKLSEHKEKINSIEDIEKIVEIDSLLTLEIILSLEEEFDIDLEDMEIDEQVIRDLTAISNIVNNQLRG